MSEQSAEVRVTAATITDRGLNEKRPLNEDSLLCDVDRRVFAVADGVGGAEAGEVASETAVEVLQQAFTHHQDGDDAEDLMEIAIQRANQSIYQLSRDHPRFAMMATTIVALHVEGRRATIGHVGDSRLYRLTPEGQLKRETDDHSVVEEEVRAGRMTAQQAANHPSRNVISRALGAEQAVEVDTKVFEVEDGTTFLLCSDGITRHIPDGELNSLLLDHQNPDEACAEMKRLCFERGAEDNLTAIVVRVGEPSASATNGSFDPERTLIREPATPTNAAPSPLSSEQTAHLKRPFDVAITPDQEPAWTGVGENAAMNQAQVKPKRGGGGRVVGVLLLLLAASAAAFYAGMIVQKRGLALPAKPNDAVVAVPTPAPETPEARYERIRRAVDLSPASEASRMETEAVGLPLNSTDPEFLYLYGRAVLRMGRIGDAATAFERAVQRANDNPTSRNTQIKIDARLAEIAVKLKSDDINSAREAAKALDEFLMPPSTATPDPSPAPTTFQ